MPVDTRKQTGFRCDPALLTEFQISLKRAGTDMSPVLEGWIADYMAGTRTLPGAQIPAEAACPICESKLRLTPKGLELIQIGPLEPLAPGEIPAELAPTVRAIMDAYLGEPIFARVVNDILALRKK